MLKSEMNYDNLEFKYYSDSEVVLGYISNEARRFHTYVGNRVQHIRYRSRPEQWHHVAGEDNPADEASRALTAKELLEDERWFRGPDLLWQSDVPATTKHLQSELRADDPEVKTAGHQSFEADNVSAVLLQTTSDTEVQSLRGQLLKYFDRFSSWQRAKVCVAKIQKAIDTFKRSRTEKADKANSSQDHLQKTESKPPKVEESQGQSGLSGQACSV